MKKFYRRLIASIAIVSGIALAQGSTGPDLHLRGGRFKPLTYAEMTPDQKKLVDNVLSGERASLDGPYNVFLRSPVMGDMAQKFGAFTRYHSALPKKLNEFAIIITGRYWNAQFEWYVHKQAALAAGLSPAVIDALAAGNRPTGMDHDETTIYDFTTELMSKKTVSDKTFQAAKSAFGEQGIVDLIAVVGYYDLVSMTLNVDGYPLPDGVKPELKPLP
jgi:4-carboxymuconolactone decarboxylase